MCCLSRTCCALGSRGSSIEPCQGGLGAICRPAWAHGRGFSLVPCPPKQTVSFQCVFWVLQRSRQTWATDGNPPSCKTPQAPSIPKALDKTLEVAIATPASRRESVRGRHCHTGRAMGWQSSFSAPELTEKWQCALKSPTPEVAPSCMSFTWWLPCKGFKAFSNAPEAFAPRPGEKVQQPMACDRATVCVRQKNPAGPQPVPLAPETPG